MNLCVYKDDKVNTMSAPHLNLFDPQDIPTPQSQYVSLRSHRCVQGNWSKYTLYGDILAFC
jgi:lipopolysaccharide export system protein LptC